MKNIFPKSQSGGALLMATILLAAIASVSTVATLGFNSIFNNYSLEMHKERQRQAVSTFQTIFSDQRFCNAFFSNGYSTNSGDYNFSENALKSSSTKHLDWLKERLQIQKDNLSGYTLKSIELKNQKALSNTPNRKIKQFEVGLTVKSENQKLPLKIFGASGSKINDLNEKLFLVLGEKGECYFRQGISEDSATGLEANAIRTACDALGGSDKDGRCFIKQFAVDKLDIPIRKNEILNKSSFADALCEMEKNILKKGNFSVPLGINNQNKKMAAGWTSLCPQPEWTGCIDGSTKYLPDTQTIVTIGTKQNKVEKILKPMVQDTLKKRYVRIASSKDGAGQNVSVKELSDGFIGSIVSFFFGGCDKAKIVITRTCKNSYLELNTAAIYTQKRKNFKCKWRHNTDVIPTSEAQIISAFKNKKPILLDITSNEINSEIDNNYTKYLDSKEPTLPLEEPTAVGP